MLFKKTYRQTNPEVVMATITHNATQKPVAALPSGEDWGESRTPELANHNRPNNQTFSPWQFNIYKTLCPLDLYISVLSQVDA